MSHHSLVSTTQITVNTHTAPTTAIISINISQSQSSSHFPYRAPVCGGGGADCCVHRHHSILLLLSSSASYVFLLLYIMGTILLSTISLIIIHVVIYSAVHFSMMFMTLLDMRSPDINGGGDIRMHTKVLG